MDIVSTFEYFRAWLVGCHLCYDDDRRSLGGVGFTGSDLTLSGGFKPPNPQQASCSIL